MARHEPHIRTSVRTELGIDELVSILAETAQSTDRERRDAIACYLSGSEGWDEAVQRLGGAFAAEAGLTGRKAD